MTQLAFGFPPSIRWTPSRLGNACSLWLDASDSGTIQIGTGVVNWWDKSSAKNHVTQATGANQPTLTLQGQNGKNVQTLDGTNDCYTTTPTITIPSSLDLAVFFVAAPAAIGAFHNIMDTNALVPMIWVDNTNNIEWNKNTAGGGVSSTASVDGTFAQYACIAKSASQEVWKNGTAEGTAASTPLSAGTVTPTIFNRGGASTLNGKLAEFIIITKAIDTNTRQQIEGYLAHKWGLKSLLPSTHPYKNSAP